LSETAIVVKHHGDVDVFEGFLSFFELVQQIALKSASSEIQAAESYSESGGLDALLVCFSQSSTIRER
jgi:hypothetical protein